MFADVSVREGGGGDDILILQLRQTSFFLLYPGLIGGVVSSAVGGIFASVSGNEVIYEDESISRLQQPAELSGSTPVNLIGCGLTRAGVDG